MNQLESNEQIVRQCVEAFNRGDFDALRSIYAPDAVVQGVLGQGGMDKVTPSGARSFRPSPSNSTWKK